MKAGMIFRKALHVLDQGRFPDGERLLRDALQKAQEEGDDVTQGLTLCCLGDLLVELQRRDEAEAILNRFQGLRREDDVLDHEARRVAELLEAIQKSKSTDSQS